jgi:type IV secretion system protein VirB1
MNRVVIHESGWNAWAIHINGNRRLSRQPANRAEAILTAQWLISHAYNVDLGLGQFNVRNLAPNGLSVADAFDPCKNLAGSAAVLTAAYKGAIAEGSPRPVLTALSYYNTGSPTAGFRNGYVQAVANTPDVPPIPLVAVLPPLVPKVPPKVAHEQLPAIAKPKPAQPAPVWDVFASHQNINVYETPHR